jgi:hypothetical protein
MSRSYTSDPPCASIGVLWDCLYQTCTNRSQTTVVHLCFSTVLLGSHSKVLLDPTVVQQLAPLDLTLVPASTTIVSQ